MSLVVRRWADLLLAFDDEIEDGGFSLLAAWEETEVLGGGNRGVADDEEEEEEPAFGRGDTLRPVNKTTTFLLPGKWTGVEKVNIFT